MFEYVVVGLLLVGIAWLVYRYSSLERQLLELQSTLPQPKEPSSDGLEESVTQMIDELKTVADNACQEVTRKIDDLKNVQREFESKVSEARIVTGGRKVLPVELVIKLADAGLSSAQIARQTGVGQAEVELTLRLHRGKKRLPTTLRRIKNAKQHPGKEIAIA